MSSRELRVRAIKPMRNVTKKLSRVPVVQRLAYSMSETAELLGLSYQTVYRLNKRGILNSSSALRHKLFPRSEIDRFLNATLPKREKAP